MASSSAVGEEEPKKRPRFSGTNDNGDSSGEVPIRTVYIHGVEPNMIDEVNRDFGLFGEIESVAMRYEDKRARWCLVQFKRAKDAKEALSRNGKCWYGCDVKAADPLDQPDHPLQVAPEQDSDSNISVALNDDCLQAIFERLKPSSLTNVAGVSKRFNAQAKIAFASKHKHLDLSSQFDRHHDSIDAMKHFGKDIQSLCIDASSFSEEANAIRMIGQNCGPKLKQLELCNFRFQIDLSSLRPTFAQIEQLKLDRCANSIGLVELMAGCEELESLSLSSYVLEDDGSILSQTFPKLQALSLSGKYITDETFEGFITRHPTLIKLSVENERLLPLIGEHAKQLQELRLSKRGTCFRPNIHFQNEVACIGQLSSLKKLQLYLPNGAIVPVLNALVAGEVPIESMEVEFNRQPDVDQAIKCIAQLKGIKVLHLKTYGRTRRVADEDVVELAKYLPELEELHLEECHLSPGPAVHDFASELSTIGLRKMLMHANKLKLLKLHSIDSIKIDVDDYKDMLSTVQKRKEKMPLLIEINGKDDQVDVPADALAENRSTFNIKLNS